MAEAAEVLDLTIDARGAEAGAAQFTAAVDRAAAGAGRGEEAVRGLNAAFHGEAEAAARARQSSDPFAITMERVGGSATTAERALERVRAQADPLYAAQQRLARQNEVLDQSYRRGLITQQEAARVSAQLQARYDALAARATAAAGAQGKLGAANDNATRSTSRFGTVAQQAGYQVGDMFSQLASGGNVLTAVVQQGSQFLGMFGPAGAVAGAALAIGGVTASMLDLGRATDSVADANARYAEAVRKSSELTRSSEEASRDAARAKLQESMQTNNLTLAEQRRVLAASTEGLARAQAQLDRLRARDSAAGSLGGPEIIAQTTRAAEAVAILQAQVANANTQIAELGRQQEILGGKYRGGADAITKFREEQEQELALSRMLSKQREIATAQLEAEATVREAMAGQDAALIEAEVARARAAAAAIVRTRQEVADAERAATAAGRDAARDREKAAKDWLGVLRAVADEQRKADEAKAEASQTIDRQIEGIRNETAQLGMSNVEREISVELLRAEEAARRAGTQVTDEQAEAIRREAAARYDRREAAQQEKKALEDAAREAERATDRVADYIGTVFADLFEKTPRSWGDMWDDMVSVARRALAKLAAEAFVTPVISPIVPTAEVSECRC